MKSRLLLGSLLSLTLLFGGCATLQSESENKRIVPLPTKKDTPPPPCTIEVNTTVEKTKRDCTELERVQRVFSTVILSGNKKGDSPTTVAGLQRLRFGPPYSTREVIPSPEIKARLTKTNDGGMELLGKEVRSCITGTSYRCKMAVFTDSYDHRIGTNNPLSRMAGIRKTDITSSWFWEAVFVVMCPYTEDEKCVDSPEEDYVVIYKQFRPFEDPSKKNDKRWPIFDSNAINIKANIP